MMIVGAVIDQGANSITYLFGKERDGFAQLTKASADHRVIGGHSDLACSLAELQLLE